MGFTGLSAERQLKDGFTLCRHILFLKSRTNARLLRRDTVESRNFTKEVMTREVAGIYRLAWGRSGRAAACFTDSIFYDAFIFLLCVCVCVGKKKKNSRSARLCFLPKMNLVGLKKSHYVNEADVGQLVKLFETNQEKKAMRKTSFCFYQACLCWRQPAASV